MSALTIGMSASALVTAVTALGIAIWAIVVARKCMQKTDDTYAAIKDRITKLVRDINNVNELEYNVDVNQQKKINALTGTTQA